jgi:hypothetical protein
VGAVILGFLLAAPAILPFLEYDHHSAENFSSHSLQRAAMHLPLNSLIFYLLPRLSGSPVDGWEETFLRLGIGDTIPNFVERTGYVGILPLLFALYAVLQRRCRVVLFYTGVIIVCFPFILGMPPLPSILAVLPVLHAINPMRLVLVVGFGVAVLAGLGWDEFQRSENVRMKIWIVAGFWVVIGLVLLGYGWAIAPRWHSLQAGCRSFLLSQSTLLAGSLLASGALFLRTISQRRNLATTVVLGWTAVDLLAFARGFNPAIPHDRYYPSTPAIDWLQQNIGHFRTLGDNMVLVPNVSEVFGLRDARGCDFTTVRRYEELIEGQPGNFNFYKTAADLPKALPLLGVKYFLVLKPLNPGPGQFEMVYSKEITIFRYRPVCERALAVYDYRVDHDPVSVLNQVRSGTFDPQHTLLLEDAPADEKTAPENPPPDGSTNTSVQILSDQADQVNIEADLPRPGFLLLLDTYFPGWVATVNGQPATIYRADYNFRAVQLPAGQSMVSFNYQPASFRIGLALSLMSALTLGAVYLWTQKKGGRS